MIIILVLLGICFLSLFIGVLLAPSSVNKIKLESDYTKMEILQIPHIFLKSWYEPNKLFVRKMIITGAIGLFIGFISLYVLSKYGLIG